MLSYGRITRIALISSLRFCCSYNWR